MNNGSLVLSRGTWNFNWQNLLVYPQWICNHCTLSSTFWQRSVNPQLYVRCAGKIALAGSIFPQTSRDVCLQAFSLDCSGWVLVLGRLKSIFILQNLVKTLMHMRSCIVSSESVKHHCIWSEKLHNVMPWPLYSRRGQQNTCLERKSFDYFLI